MLLVDDGEPEIVERDLVLEQGMGADDDVDGALREPGEDRPALGARSRPVRRAMRRPAATARGARRSKCWRARISVGAIRAACRPASIGARHGEKRDRGLAGADIALEQAEHARVGDEVGADLRHRLVL